MKTPYSFLTLRYIHDVVTGEFANVGVVVYAPEQNFLAARFTDSYKRLNALFVRIDHSNYRRVIRYLQARFVEMSVELRSQMNLQNVLRIEELVQKVLPKDDSSLQWSPVGTGFTNDLNKTTHDLYERMIERYSKSTDAGSRTDDDIVRPFKTALHEKVHELTQRVVNTPDITYEFQYAWKNDIWHLYEPVSFDLKDEHSIEDKAHKWLGRGVALSDAEIDFQIHFLLGEPKSIETEKAFLRAQHLLEKIPVPKEFIHEKDIPAFAAIVAQQMESHSEDREK